MKKFLALLLAALFAVAPLLGCGIGNGLSGATSTTAPISDEPLPEGFDAKKIKAETYRDLPEISVWESGENEFYVYIKAWNAYRIINVSSTLSSGGHVTAFGNTCAVVGESTATLALYNHDFVDVEATVYTFKRNDHNTAVYQGKFHAGEHFYECPDVFINTLDVDHVSFFYTTEYDPGFKVQFLRVDTSDGGKTWSEPTEIEVRTFLKQSPTDIMRFLSHEVGVIGYRYYYSCDLSDRTYFTFDGGKTWERMSKLTYPGKMQEVVDDDIVGYGYSEILDLEKTENGYLLTVRVQNNVAETDDIIYFTSEDLKSWEFEGFGNYDSVLSIYRKIVELCPRDAWGEGENYFSFTDETDKTWYDKIFYSTWCLYPRNDGFDGDCYESFGYARLDIDKNGTEELLLYANGKIAAIFTEKNGRPVLLDYFWDRKGCSITKDGYIYVGGSSGAAAHSVEVYGIDESTAEYVLLYGCGTDGYDAENGTAKYYKMKDGQMTYISEEEYNEWVENCPYDLSKNEDIEIIPIFDDEHPAPPPFVAPPDKG